VVPQGLDVSFPFFLFGYFRSLFLGFRSSLDSSIWGRFSPDFFEGIIGECLVPLCG
jgi:hypothetical protein